MKNFDIKRFGHAIVWTAQSAKKQYLNMMATLFILFLIFPLWNMLLNIGGSNSFMEANLFTAYGIDIAILTVFDSMTGCWIFSNMKTKGQRISFKMLPATDLEKYLVRFLYVTIGLVGGSFLVFMLADAVRMLIYLIVYHDHIFSMTAALFDNHSVGVDIMGCTSPVFGYIFTLGAGLAAHAFTVLCGTFFRRGKVVLTGLTAMTLFTAVGITLVFISDLPTFGVINRADASAIVCFIGIVLMIAAALQYWLSYKLFRRMQVINNKWFNV